MAKSKKLRFKKGDRVRLVRWKDDTEEDTLAEAAENGFYIGLVFTIGNVDGHDVEFPYEPAPPNYGYGFAEEELAPVARGKFKAKTVII